mgnify:CR=1 FL=1
MHHFIFLNDHVDGGKVVADLLDVVVFDSGCGLGT